MSSIEGDTIVNQPGSEERPDNGESLINQKANNMHKNFQRVPVRIQNIELEYQ